MRFPYGKAEADARRALRKGRGATAPSLPDSPEFLTRVKSLRRSLINVKAPLDWPQ
jgi:hypothetical protein